MDRNRKPRSRNADPSLVRAFLDQGRALRSAGSDEMALDLACRAIRLEENDETRRFFVACVRGWAHFPGVDEMAATFARALRERWTEPSTLLSCVLGILRRHAVVGPIVQRAVAAWPDRPGAEALLGRDGLRLLAEASLLTALLQATPVPDRDFEILLTLLRCALGEIAATRTRIAPDALPLYAALAQQCCINEYVFAVTDAERNRMDELRARAAAHADTGAAIPPHWVAALAAYAPLESLKFRQRIAKGQPAVLAALLHQQLAEPAAIRKYAREIPQLTAIDDEVSRAVRAHYETNPYPRWTRVASPEITMSFAETIAAKFGFAEFRAMREDRLDVLMAGCGTGRQAADYGHTFPDARVLAVDLSLASLAYARAKTAEAGVRNVEYAQADILELGGLGRSFDVIVATGVLHHTADPLAAWRVLLGLLQPHGIMNVALYSRTGRAGISDAQRWLAAAAYAATSDDIRRARQDLMRTDKPEWKSVFAMPDFYSLSECRDLLFHQHELLFDLPEIAQFLRANDLRFVGFEMSAATRQRFRSRFPEASLTDLDAWHAFEREDPDTFVKMYQFWACRKPVL